MNSQSLRKFVNRLTLSSRLTPVYDRLWPATSLGKRGEREAERFLLRLGMIIVARSYEDRAGEIDLIAIDDETVVFVEVKTRTSASAGDGFEAVDEVKQKKIARTAMGFLKRYKLLDRSCRFDVISIRWPEKEVSPSISHYKNAFESPDQFQMYS